MPYTVAHTVNIEVTLRVSGHDESSSRGREFRDERKPLGAGRNLHGHSLAVTVTLEGDHLDQQGFLMDTALLEGALGFLADDFASATILDRHDPLYGEFADLLNRNGLKLCTVDYPPTFEGLVTDFHDRIEAILAQSSASAVRLREVRLQSEGTVVVGYTRQ